MTTIFIMGILSFFCEGLKEAHHECKYCAAKYIVGHKIHRTHTSYRHDSFDF